MGDAFSWVMEMVTAALADNDFFAGGLMLAVFGMLSGFLYRLVGPLKAFLKRRYTITIEVRDREPFRWVAEWLAGEATERGCRLLSVSEDSAEKPGETVDEMASKAIWVDDGYGDWDESELQTGRPIDSVILEGDNADSMIRDLEAFFSTRERYEQVGAPYRRGYLFHGPPGCGKTSLAKAMATESGANLYVLSVSSNKLTDEGLVRRLSRMKPRSIVVLEDVDAAFHGRDSNGDGVTFSGLLNAIDGVASSEGRILVMTTNHKDKLDPALIRPGRADVHLELGLANADMAARLFMRFFPDDPLAARRFALSASGVTPAAIQVHLFKHWDDVKGAVTMGRESPTVQNRSLALDG